MNSVKIYYQQVDLYSLRNQGCNLWTNRQRQMMMGRRTNWLDCSFVLLVLALLCWDNSVLAKKKKDEEIIKKCETCRDLVKKFDEVCIVLVLLTMILFNNVCRCDQVKCKILTLTPTPPFSFLDCRLGKEGLKKWGFPGFEPVGSHTTMHCPPMARHPWQKGVTMCA